MLKSGSLTGKIVCEKSVRQKLQLNPKGLTAKAIYPDAQVCSADLTSPILSLCVEALLIRIGLNIFTTATPFAQSCRLLYKFNR